MSSVFLITHFPPLLSSSISSNFIGGLCDLELDGELREGGSESESSYQPTKFPGRPLQQIKSASPISLSRSESSFSSFGNSVRWGASSSKTNEKATNPTSEALSGNTSYNHDITTAAVPPPLNTSSHLFRSGGVHAFLDPKCISLKKRSKSMHECGAGNLDCEIFEPKNH